MCAVLAFTIGVAATRLTIAVRHRFRNNPTISSNKEQVRQLLKVPKRRVWPEPRPLDVELIDADKLVYDGFLEPVYQFIYKNLRDFKQTARISLPSSMKSSLDKNFPGWSYLPVEEEVRTFLKEYVSEYARPDIIKGDFDGNGLVDYAVLIEEQTTLPKKAKAEMRMAHLVVFLTKAAGFQMKVLDPEGAYLVLLGRGDWDYSYETSEYFTYQNDAIFTGIFEKGGTSYLYEKGSFRSIITSD